MPQYQFNVNSTIEVRSPIDVPLALSAGARFRPSCDEVRFGLQRRTVKGLILDQMSLYSPELNSNVHLWKTLKSHLMPRTTWDTMDRLAQSFLDTLRKTDRSNNLNPKKQHFDGCNSEHLLSKWQSKLFSKIHNAMLACGRNARCPKTGPGDTVISECTKCLIRRIIHMIHRSLNPN